MLKGYLTGMLRSEHVAAGFSLTEDEDFLYLHVPGKASPVVFSVVGADIESVNSYIEEVQADKVV